ncbi:MAG: hypothetical protein ABI705_07940 [Aestuariivirga sp.]
MVRKSQSRKAKPKIEPAVTLASPQKKPAVINFLSLPPRIDKPKRIQPRRLLPLVREGVERNVHSISPEIRLNMRAAPAALGDEIEISTNTELVQPSLNQTASNVGEPSCAINGTTVLYTGNWYAAISTDGGANFRYIDIEQEFPGPSPNIRFCCDQIAHYIPALDTFVWLMQYGPSSGDNIQRLAFATTANVAAGRWKLFDITPQSLGVAGAFLDYPDIAVGKNCIYVTTNIFGPGNIFGSAVVRISFAAIKSGNITATPFVSHDLQSFRVAQNCGATAYFAAHRDTSTLAVFSWPEDSPRPKSTDVSVARWIGGNGYLSRTPDGNRWLDRADPRITGATLANKELWFAWSVDRGSNRRARPFIQIARINTATLAVIENINVFDPQSATCYAALATNAENEIGISYMVGGGPRFPSHVVGFMTGTRLDVVAAEGERAPLPDPDDGKGEWGDYLSVRPVAPKGKLFAATGYTMKGPGNGSNRDSTPRFVIFGRKRNGSTPAITPSDPGPATVPPVPTVTPPSFDDVTQPFRDVNALPIVSPATAAAIKAACLATGSKDDEEERDQLQPLKMVTKPGVERWPVKTGGDIDIGLVGKNMIDGRKLPSGIVEATIEELTRFGRPPDMRPVSRLFRHYQARRRGPVEFVVWRLECEVRVLKLERDGDYHLVLEGASGETLIAEVPTPYPPYLTEDCPWTENIADVRAAIDNQLVAKLSPRDFVQWEGTLVPRQSLPEGVAPQAMALDMLPRSFVTPPADQQLEMPTFQTKVKPTPARITGVGFFDKVHGQTGVSQFNGIELHPILKIEWI